MKVEIENPAEMRAAVERTVVSVRKLRAAFEPTRRTVLELARMLEGRSR
jgi:hypothetical protein